MIITTHYNTILNLSNYDAIRIVSKDSYSHSQSLIESLIFDDQGNIQKVESVMRFKTKTEAAEHLEGFTKGTGYVSISQKKDVILLNLARYDVIRIVSYDSNREKESQLETKGIVVNHVGPPSDKIHIIGVAYDATGEVRRSYRLASFENNQQALDYLKSLNTGD